MIVINFLILFNSHQIIGDCSFSDFMISKRGMYQHIVQNYGSINFVFDYEFVKKPYKRSKLNFLDFFNRSNIEFYEPILLIDKKDKFGIEIKANANILKLSDISLIAYMINENKNIEIDREFLEVEKCSNDVKTIHWNVSFHVPFILIMLGCYVNPTERGFEVTKRVILLSDNSSAMHKNITNGLSFNQERFSLRNFYDGRFCMCHNLDSFYNDCREEKEEMRIQIIFIISIFILIGYILLEILYCVIGNGKIGRISVMH